MRANRKDLAAGGFFVAVGLLYGGIAWASLPIGRTLSMGPGYFPLVLSGILIVVGGLLVGQAALAGGGTPFGAVPWRAVAMISAALIAFAALLAPLGLFPTVFLTVFLATRASPEIPALRGAAIALGVAALCAAIFVFGVRLPAPLLGTWFSV